MLGILNAVDTIMANIRVTELFLIPLAVNLFLRFKYTTDWVDYATSS
jgi:hypothetical protein